ncbi:MAG: arginine--tRNA ligase [Candidatus Pacebacteria bacterium]|nr:arginine--tRNA ligase [Candidatus Paceibacterota bacterium]NUQ57366.1 arginine--tRNA ligase [Candidatus Paceibacter sp.]
MKGESPQSFFESVKKEAQKSIEKTKKRIAKEISGGKFRSLNDYAAEKIRNDIFEAIKDSVKVMPENISPELPPAHIAADLSLPIFELAKAIGKNPAALAAEIAGLINNAKQNFISKAETAGPFVNLFLNKKKVYSLAAAQPAKFKEKFGQSDANAGKAVLLDYSGPNIAKPIGVGHLRSTVIGQALANIYKATGCSVIKDNHLGDWGTQFGKLVYAYKKWGDKKKIAQDPIRELNNLYVKFHEEAEKNPKLEDEARAIFKKMEEGDEKLLRLWKKFRKISLAEFKKVYKKLGVSFDTYIGESYFAKETDKIIEECLDKKLAKIDSETKAVAVEGLDGLPSFLLRKKDDSGLYITRDLATLIFRMEVFEPDEILYVVGEEQSLHFKQLFALAKTLGYTDGAKAKHIGFGLVLSGGEKMSTRKGTLIELEELMKQSVEKSKEILRQKNRELSEKEIEEISEIVGVGAVIYNDLRQSRQNNISFDWERMLDFEGGSAAYLQYTYARINSIIRKVGYPDHQGDALMSKRRLDGKISNPVFEKDSEFALAKKMMFFPRVILSAQKRDAPHLIAVYLEELAQLFNHFYNEVSIIGTENAKLRASRITLVKSVAAVIKNGLALLNIKTAERI